MSTPEAHQANDSPLPKHSTQPYWDLQPPECPHLLETPVSADKGTPLLLLGITPHRVHGAPDDIGSGVIRLPMKLEIALAIVGDLDQERSLCLG